MTELRPDCARCVRLLARLDDASAHDVDDPAAVLPGDEVAWLARHLESCVACAPDPGVITSLAGLLRDEPSAAPDDAFFAVRRTALLDAIRASDTSATDGGVVGAGAPARVATRPTLRAIPGTGARAAARGTRRDARRRSLWRPVLPALAAGLAIAVALGVLSARAPRPTPADVAVIEIASNDVMAELAADSADDTWVVASSDPFELALSSTSDPALDELSDDDLDEIEDLLAPSPGWS